MSGCQALLQALAVVTHAQMCTGVQEHPAGTLHPLPARAKIGGGAIGERVETGVGERGARWERLGVTDMELGPSPGAVGSHGRCEAGSNSSDVVWGSGRRRDRRVMSQSSLREAGSQAGAESACKRKSSSSWRLMGIAEGKRLNSSWTVDSASPCH
jgi:hypothetical protein